MDVLLLWFSNKIFYDEIYVYQQASKDHRITTDHITKSINRGVTNKYFVEATDSFSANVQYNVDKHIFLKI